MSALADHVFTGDPPQLLGGPVDQDIPLLAHVLHEYRDRHVLDDGIEEGLRALELQLGLTPLGDVLVGGDPAAVRHRLIDDADRTSVADLHRATESLRLGQAGAKLAMILIDVARKGSSLLAMSKQVANRQAGLHHVG